jgi:hypothetical protein
MAPGLDALRLLEVDADIAVPRTLVYKVPDGKTPQIWPSAFIYDVMKDRKYAPVNSIHFQGVCEIDAAGTAAMLIRRKVFEDRRMWLPGEYPGLYGESLNVYDEMDEKMWAAPIFRTLRKPNGAPFVGEDLDFCTRAKNLGYSIKCDLSIKVGHVKGVDLENVVQYAAAEKQAVLQLKELMDREAKEKECSAASAG